jgi:CRISPR-associated protein Cas5h
MEILAFDICGKFAHFRKFYSNSSALTHFIPPRTTVAGMIAGILGIERDAYYETFSSENCDIGIRLLTRVKKSIQKLKYLKVEHPNHLNGSFFDPNKKKYISNTMVPFEFLIPMDVKEENSIISYRCYYRSKNEKTGMHFEKLKKQLHNKKKCHFPLSMGTANFSAFIGNIILYEGRECRTDDCVSIDSSIPVSCLRDFPRNPEYHLIQESLPMEFDKNRNLKKHSQILFNLNCEPLHVKLASEYFLLQNKNYSENILFLN